MPILFDCPRCDASIQVPDSAAGKKGSCPSCQAKLRVPDVAPPPPRMIEFDCPRCRAAIRVPEKAIGQKGHCPQCRAKVLVPDPQAVAPTANAPSSAGSLSDGEIGTGLPSLDAGMFSTPMETTPFVPPRIRRGNRLVIPAFLAIVFLGVVAWLYLRPDDSLRGTMTIERLAQFEFSPVLIPEASTGLSRTRYRELARELEGDPFGLNTTLSRVELSSKKEKIYCSLSDGVEAGIYRVDPRKRAGLMDWIARHHADLNASREQEVDRDMPKLISAVRAARESGDLEAVASFRDTAVLGSLTGSLGYHAVAVVSGSAYRCVFEDSEGRLYFLLPGSTKSFVLRGRPLANGTSLFPGIITCSVAKASSSRTVKEVEPVDEAPAAEPTTPSEPGEESPLSAETEGSEMPVEEASESTESMAGDMSAAKPAGKRASKSKPKMMASDEMTDEAMDGEAMEGEAMDGDAMKADKMGMGQPTRPGKPKLKAKPDAAEEMMPAEMEEMPAPKPKVKAKAQ